MCMYYRNSALPGSTNMGTRPIRSSLVWRVVPAIALLLSARQIGRDSLLIGAGVSVVLNDRVSTYIYYDGEFARTNYLGNNVSAGVRVTF